MNQQELHLLIDQFIEGEITEADLIRLEAELTVDPEARREYYARVQMTVMLEAVAKTKHLEIDSLPLENASPSSKVSDLLRQDTAAWLSTGWKSFAIGATAAMLIFAFGWWVVPRESARVADTITPSDSPETLQPAEPQSRGFAVIAAQAGAVWSDNVPRSNGTLIVGESMRLKEGLIQLELFSGVNVVIEGDAQFLVRSPMEMHLDHGRVRADVPEAAIGFTVHTAAGDAYDLGTVFAIDANRDESKLHVLEGEVRWNVGESSQLLKTGQAIRKHVDGSEEWLASEEGSFSSPEDLLVRSQTERSGARAVWQDELKVLQEDPRLVLLYGFQSNQKSRRMPNLAVSESRVQNPQASGGAIVAAKPTTDRWGIADEALDFGRAGSRVRTKITEPIGSMTLACWVKIHSLDRWYNSLFLTDGHDLHEPHWQIMNDGRLFFSVKKNNRWDPDRGEKDKHIFYSPPFWRPSLSGQWMLIATTYDLEKKKVVHYIDGEVLSEEAIPAEYLVPQISIGNASIGNWDFPERDDAAFAVRNLNGAIDDFMLWKTALSTEEIKRLFEQGKP